MSIKIQVVGENCAVVHLRNRLCDGLFGDATTPLVEFHATKDICLTAFSCQYDTEPEWGQDVALSLLNGVVQRSFGLGMLLVLIVTNEAPRVLRSVYLETHSSCSGKRYVHDMQQVFHSGQFYSFFSRYVYGLDE